MSAPTKRAIQAALSFYAGEGLPPEDTPPAPRRNARPEAAALAEVLKTLHGHPAVAWCERMNSGAHVEEGPTGRRFIRYGFKGCPDVVGQLTDGRFLGVEVKARGGRLRPEQAIFLERVRAAGGVAFVARNCVDVLEALQPSSQQGPQAGGGVKSLGESRA